MVPFFEEAEEAVFIGAFNLTLLLVGVYILAPLISSYLDFGEAQVLFLAFMAGFYFISLNFLAIHLWDVIGGHE